MEPKTAAAVIIDKLGAMKLKAAGDEEFLEMVTDETWEMRNELGLRGDSNWAYVVEDAIRELLGIEHTLRGQALADFKQATANEGAIKVTRSAVRSPTTPRCISIVRIAARPGFVSSSRLGMVSLPFFLVRPGLSRACSSAHRWRVGLRSRPRPHPSPPGCGAV